ncbi:MAG TPA: alpha-ketoacid dehydrogenase subunit beta [Thermoprotei archaeon]|nr:alpha-ketoacid dehydrogenase subunit beta [Thermoprotei archaeon]
MPQINMVEALNMALREEMERDDRVVVLGEDIGRRGGVFLVTDGLIDLFGEERVIDTPLTELGIIGFSIGLALYGLRPVAEIQFIDFVYEAFDQIYSNMARIRFRSGGMYNVPLVLRSPCCGGIKGGMHHSQSPESLFIHTTGLYVMMPSGPYDAKGLLKTAIRLNDPVIFLEPKSIYRVIKEEVPEDDYTIELGKGKIVREGGDITLVTWGAMVHISKQAADIVKEKLGVEVEIIDLRTLYPYDKDLIIDSLEKTGRMLIVHEAPKTLGLGSELSAYIVEEHVDLLYGPILRVTGYDTPFPLAHEKLYMPNIARIYNAISKLMEY